MPALAPPIASADTVRLLRLGQSIRAHRKGLRVSATAAAEAAGISRVTLHRIERGEPSVAMASYMSAATALGLELEVVNRQPAAKTAVVTDASVAGQRAVRLADHPQLQRLVWQHLGASQEVSPEEALNLYERNWRHVDLVAMDEHERAFVQALARSLGRERLLV